MRVLLPSKGYFGCKSLKMRLLNIGDLRTIKEFGSDEFINKFSLVKLLTNCNFSKISYDDLNYLYQIALYGCVHNQAIFSITCPECGKAFKEHFFLGSQDVDTLNKDTALFDKSVHGVQFHFQILSAQDVLDCYDYSLFSEHNMTFEQCITLKTAYHSFESDYPPYFYESIVTTFNRLNFHGINLSIYKDCPHCGNSFSYSAALDMSIFDGSLENIMGSFSRVCDFISFEDLLRFTVDEYSSFISGLNKRLNG